MQATGMLRRFISNVGVLLCLGIALAFALRVAFGISLATMMLVVLLTPVPLYILMLFAVSGMLLARARLRRPSPPGTLPRDDGDGGWAGVREPRRPLPPTRDSRATALRDD